MKQVRDPEFDQPDTPVAGVCTAGRCDGSGWVPVSEAYVQKHAPTPTMRLPDVPTAEEQFVYDAVMREWRLLAAAFRNSSYPCPACQPGPFHRWSGGHWTRDHNRSDCNECWMADFPSRARQRGSTRKDDHEPDPPYTGDSDGGTSALPPRADLD